MNSIYDCNFLRKYNENAPEKYTRKLCFIFSGIGGGPCIMNTNQPINFNKHVHRLNSFKAAINQKCSELINHNDIFTKIMLDHTYFWHFRISYLVHHIHLTLCHLIFTCPDFYKILFRWIVSLFENQ